MAFVNLLKCFSIVSFIVRRVFQIVIIIWQNFAIAENVLRHVQKERYYMENLKRYGPCLSRLGFATMHKLDNGGWVKFSEIKVLLQTAQNTGSPKLPTWEEVYKWAMDSHGTPDLDHDRYAILRGCYEFICRQLRASA